MRGQASTIGELQTLLKTFTDAGYGPECKLNPKHRKREDDPEPIPWVLHLWVEKPLNGKS